MTRLLYVEDDADVRAFVNAVLTNEGYGVVAVGSAEEGADALGRGEFDLLLTDYNLPGRNADWMLRAAAGRGLLDDVPVIVLTGSLNPSGVDGYRVLRKPVDIEVLLAAIDGALAARERARRPAGTAAGQPVIALTLYITGTSRESQRAVRSLQRILESCDASRCRLVVHDVAGDIPPDLLEEDRIVVTPTLVRTWPLPKVWVYGDLSRTGAVEDLLNGGDAS